MARCSRRERLVLSGRLVRLAIRAARSVGSIMRSRLRSGRLPVAARIASWKSTSTRAKASTSSPASSPSSRKRAIAPRSAGVACSAARAAASTSTVRRTTRRSTRKSSARSRSLRALRISGASSFQLSYASTSVPRPCRLRIIPSIESALAASRTTGRLTPNCWQSSSSVGRSCPGRYRPSRMLSTSWRVIRSESVSVAVIAIDSENTSGVCGRKPRVHRVRSWGLPVAGHQVD